jgi:exopolysaccharide biosynthesis polyprenyl glycosylphosphotransferase
MLRQQAKLFNRLSILCDSCAISLAFFVAYLLRSQWTKQLLPWQEYSWVLLVAIPVWCMLLYRNDLYASIRKLSKFDLMTRLFNSIVPGAIIIAAFIYFFDRQQYSRSFYGAFVLVSFLFLTIEKVTLKAFLSHIRRKGLNTKNMLIVGTFEKASEFQRLVEEHADWGLRVLGYVQVYDGELKESVGGHRVLGKVADLVEICKSFPVDEVVFCLQKDQVVDTEEYFKPLEELGITVRMVLDFFNVSYVRKEISIFHDSIPVLTFHSKAFDAQQLFAKRLLDVFGSLFGLCLFIIMFPILAIAIKANSPGPIFFGQERVRENGRLFKCWKLRSMYIDAEERKKDLMDQNEMSGAIFKMKDDPRITSIGKFIRKTSLDEFPQFWNVLKGEMSLVGTRPPTPDEVENYENWHRRRISIKPGITGMWQVNGRSNIEDFDEIVRLDLQYIDNWSLWLDIRLLFMTVFVVFANKDSY